MKLKATSFKGVIAAFRDADTAGTFADYHAAVAWGDATASAATVDTTNWDAGGSVTVTNSTLTS